MFQFSTYGRRPIERARQWEECVSRIFPALDITPLERVAFQGRIDWRQICAFQISDLELVAQRAVRTKRHVEAATDDLVQINFQLAGEGVVEQCGRTAITRPGEFVIYHSLRPYEMRFGGAFRQISIEMPSELLRREFGSFEAFTAITISGSRGLGRFLYDFVRSLARDDLPFEARAASRIQSHVVDLLVTGLVAVQADEKPSGLARRERALSEVKRYIRANLRDPELSPRRVANAQNMSLRNLYLLFEQEDEPIARWIQNARLERSKADLEAHSHDNRSVSDIAFGWGFSDSAHFSRVFRQRFRMSPRECRRAAGH